MVVKKKMDKKLNKTSKDSSINRKDFETFKFGVQRLKELGEEFNSVDTRGFSKEAQKIKSKLNNVSEIPNIERELKELKLKITRKYKPQKKRRNLIKKDIEDIKEDIPELKEEIKKLSKKVGTSKKNNIGVDSGVGSLVDIDFNSFLNDIKTSLSGRIRNREKEIDDTLKIDLQKRDQKFNDKSSNLIREFNAKQRKLEEEFNKKYATKVKVSLHKEVSDKFNKEVKEKLDLEKVALGKAYKSSLKKHAIAELEKQKKSLAMKLQKGQDILNKNLKEKLLSENIAVEKAYEKSLKEQANEELEKQKKSLAVKLKRGQNMLNKKLKEKLASENIVSGKAYKTSLKEQANVELEKQKKSLADKLKQGQKILNLKFKEKLASEDDKLQKDEEAFNIYKEEERGKMHKEFADEFHKKLESELTRKEKILKTQLQNDYDLKLKTQLQEQEAEMKKKKIDLELEMQKKIKQILVN